MSNVARIVYDGESSHFLTQCGTETEAIFGKLTWDQLKSAKFRADPRLHALLKEKSYRIKEGDPDKHEYTDADGKKHVQHYIGDHDCAFVPCEYLEAGAVEVRKHGYEGEYVVLDHGKYQVWKINNILAKHLRDSDKIRMISRIAKSNIYEHFNTRTGEIEFPSGGDK